MIERILDPFSTVRIRIVGTCYAEKSVRALRLQGERFELVVSHLAP
jgi:hypothetical protein